MSQCIIMTLQDGSKDGTRRQSARNPRRRQRHDSDSLQHQPRRKRSKIATDTYEAPDATDKRPNGNTHNDTNGTILPNGHTDARGRSTTPIDSLDIPLRAKKSTQKRAIKGDGSTVLVWRTKSLYRSPTNVDTDPKCALFVKASTEHARNHSQ